MRTSTEIKERLEKVFDKAQASVLIEVIVDAYGELVKAGDFNELKAIVKELAEAQRRTEIKVAELAEDIRILVRGLGETRSEVGGLSRSVSYALENEAYRGLPEVLKRSYGIELKDRLIRAEIGGKEINIFGRAKRDGRDVLVVGEAKLRLDERRKKGERDVFEELEEKGRAVRWEYGETEIVSVLITHYATKGFMREAKERNIIVIQSCEW